MIKLNKNELRAIRAGAGITGTLLNAILKGIDSFMDVGRYLGSGLRRLIGGKLCSLK